MKLDARTLFLLVVVALGVGVVAYRMGAEQGGGPAPQATAPAPQPAPAPAAVPPAPAPESAAAAHARAGVELPADNGRFTRFRTGNRNVKALLVDDGVVWVGTSGGVVRYDPRTEDTRFFDVRSGLLSNGIFYLGKLQGRLAVGTYGGGLSLLYDAETGSWDNYNIQHGLADAFVYDVLEASNGDIWIATWSGANRVRGGRLDDRAAWDTFTVKNTQGGLPNDWVYGLDEGPDGSIWLATEGGLARFKDGAWQHWTHDDGLGAPYEKVKEQNPFQTDPAQVSAHHARQKQEQGLTRVSGAYNPNYVISMVVTPDGAVWCGTWGGGLARLKDGQWTNFTMDEGLPGNHIFMLHVDRRGRLWVGTNNGLTRYEDGRFTPAITQRDGLVTSNVFSMADGEDGFYWIGTFGGVTRMKME
ncbi:ligand-binding sensor domain-containing protein [Inmirania thermothiophila]|uniref:Two component regulator with propeller domain n=1 Tax=Inmirania thermothiophila TaxID=1750597 RepID=A0A3N1Y5K6_9GAMM|nr:two-component regulator propeller domain-containing protein [Inmirania thermothiophila]ROR32902.1 two component regulator with propeller domain [Inmirania thermothiophila]